MPVLTPIANVPQYLWTQEVPTNLPIFNNAPAFNPSPKTYGTGSNLVDEATANKNKVNILMGEGYWVTYYSGNISQIMNEMGKVSPNGIQTFSNTELDSVAQKFVNATERIVIVDFEPSDPDTEIWKWNYAHPNFQNTMNYLANKVQELSGGTKYFYDWISARVTFTHSGKAYSIDGADNDGFAGSDTSSNSVDNILAVHANPSGVSNLKTPTLHQIGMGYTAITFNGGRNGAGILPATKYLGVQNCVLKCLDGLALKSVLTPNLNTVGYFWPLEDKPVPGRRSNQYTKFKPNSTVPIYVWNSTTQQTEVATQAQNLNGKATIIDNRLTYPANIVEDTILTVLTYPKIIHNEYWLHGGGYNPYGTMKFIRSGGKTKNCDNYEFFIGNYDGTDNPPCSTNSLADYLGIEGRTLTSFIKAHQKYSVSLKSVLTGNQVQEFYQFQYKRQGQSSFTSSVFANHTGQAALAWKHEQPLLIVWRNPTTGKRVILLWDLFADAFNPTEFKFTISGTEYTGTTKGNRLFTSIIETLSPISPCTLGPTLTGITSVTSTGLTFSFTGTGITSLNWRIKSGSTVVTTNTANSSGGNVAITYGALASGNYTLEIEGANCTSSVSSLSFTVAPVASTGKELIFVVNLTGGGFNFTSPSTNFVSSSQLTLVQNALTGPNSDVIDAIRMPFRWGEYNPSPGVYRDAELTQAINYVRNLRPSNPVKIDLMVIPILLGNDNRIPSNELAVDNNGNLQDCTYNSLFTTVPSYHSVAMTSILDTGYNHLLPYLNTNHGSHIRMMELAAGQSEEHYMPFTANNPTSGPQCGNVYSGIGDYSNSSKLAWRTWLQAKYGSENLPYLINGNQYTASNAELPNVGVTTTNNMNMNYSQPAYRDLFRFYSKGIFNIWKRFHDKVKALTNFKTGYFIPDMLNEQGTKWIFHGGTIFEAMKYADQFYHTHNISPSFWQANLWGTDTLLGTFPNQGKLSGIEYDIFDVGGGSPNNNHVKQSILAFIKNGGKVVHTALEWNSGQMNDWKTLIKDIKDNYINNPSWTLNSRTGIATATVDTSQIFNNPYVYETAWKSVGGNNVTSNPASYNAVPVNIVIQNNGTIDNFYL